MNSQPTSQVLRNMAENLEEEARKMRRYADQLERDGDFNIAGYAINSIVNLLGNLRLDLLVIRPLRECEMEIQRADLLATKEAIK